MKECLHEWHWIHIIDCSDLECKKCNRNVYDIYSLEDANTVIHNFEKRKTRKGKFRIIKEGDRYKIQEKKWFLWFTLTDTDVSPIGEMYPPMDITYATFEEAAREIPFPDKVEVVKTFN